MRLGHKLRAAFAFALIAGCALAVASVNTGRAQFPIPNPAGAAQDAAVRAALSSFGKAVGDQLPIVVSPSDAYPTAQLPGAPFAAGAAPNITSLLRASSDGTVALPPGDYTFTVDVFCMKAHAHSPSAHRYLVAPLRGAAADVFRALNARAPSYALNHGALQVLSWDIQAGLPYSAMPVAQRTIVDRVIPDFRSRLNADVYTNIRAQYDQVASKVPGMPSFDSALGRLGPTGQAILEMQRLRDEMAQPPPTFDELVRELIPFAPPEHNVSGDTPWSRYSDRVYVRFVTSGNFATPGTYEVRVLAGNQVSTTHIVGLGPPGGGAPVPFSNVVNNPGTDSVQPLTQAPQPGGAPLLPTPSPSPTASITSETVATQPADRTRTEVGVNEPVILTFSGASAQWTISGGQGKLSTTSGKTVKYTASITPATETITAVDTSTHASASITFTVIQPQDPLFEVVPATEATPAPDPDFWHHIQGYPGVGFYARVYLPPDTVSFQYIKVRERDVQFSANGYYTFENGVWHIGDNHRDPNPPWVEVRSLEQGKGWLLKLTDSIWSGAQPNIPFNPGKVSAVIPWEYTSVSNQSLGPFNFATVTQVCELHGDRSTLTCQKGTASTSSSVSAPSYK
ncbi:MAG: hypothetical protein JO219_04495 [Candidatus Eremiobacteraeota bacterium]|nr:hypothetical protein [Candidatus Eremiobacteraeota bacterium]MBV8366762.1 hypothetical protein [Candidatus Eremiobacteraeota bacterium]